MADPDLQIRGGGGGHPDPEIKGAGSPGPSPESVTDKPGARGKRT